MSGSKDSECLTVVGVNGDRFLQQRLGDQIVLSRHAPVIRHRPHDQIPRIHAVRRLTLGPKIFCGIELRLDRGDDGLSDLILNRKHVGEAAVKMLRPYMASSGHVVKLGCNTHPVGNFAHATLYYVVHAKFLGDLFEVDSLAFVDEGRVSCDHEEPAQLRQRSDDILGNAVGKILLLRIATHVREGKHGDGRPIGSRGQRLADLIRRQRGGIGPFDVGRARLTDKAQTLTRYGADQLLLVAAITDRFPRGIDTTCKSRSPTRSCRPKLHR